MSFPSGTIVMTPSPVHSLRGHPTLDGLFLGAALMLACSSAAAASSTAAGSPAGRPVQTAMLAAEAERPAAAPAASSTEQDMLCSRVRKRFWVEGEGWVVRRVSACR